MIFQEKKIILVFLLAIAFLFVKGQSVGYYNGIQGKSGDELKSALNQLISHHVDFTYGFAKNIINYSDADPNNEDNVVLFYLQESRDASQYGTGGDFINREHVWAKSHGYFGGIRPLDSDAHNLRPADASVNEDRGNKDFDNIQPAGNQHPEALYCYYTDSTWEPGALTKGQVARILFYMATRYEGNDDEMDLELVNHNHTFPEALHGNLDALLTWNKQYPPTDFERRRNERLYLIQQNRNPFVDHPEFADFIWGKIFPEGPVFSNFEMAPNFPVPGEQIEVSIELAYEGELGDVVLCWGNEFDPEENQISMEPDDAIYSVSIQPDGFQPGDRIYLSVKTTVADSTYSWRANHLYPEHTEFSTITSIPFVQGENSESPFLNQEVTIAGRVSANFDYSFYLQTNAETRSGINIYNSLFRGKPGDSLIVRGTIAEYNNLTEMTDVSYTYNYHSNKNIESKIITAIDFNEDYEGMLVTVKGVSFSEGGQLIPEQNSSYTFNDQSGSAELFIASSSRLAGEILPSGFVNVTGVLSQYQNTYQLLPRDKHDFELLTGINNLEVQTNFAFIYPNPVKNMIHIQSSMEIKQVEIYNNSGLLLMQKQNDIHSIEASGLLPGLYFIKIISKNNQISRRKIIKI